jgi:hypothetical protein
LPLCGARRHRPAHVQNGWAGPWAAVAAFIVWLGILFQQFL